LGKCKIRQWAGDMTDARHWGIWWLGQIGSN